MRLIGVRVNPAARETSSSTSNGSRAFSGSGAAGSQMSCAICQRPRNVAVSSQLVSSQPDTFGGMNRYQPALSHSHAHAVVSIPRETARSMPAACTAGGLTIRRPGS